MTKEKTKIEIMLINKTIMDIEVDGFGVNIVFTDGSKFYYSASDGGFSAWSLINEKGKEE